MNYDEIAHMVQKAEQYAEYFCESIGDTGHHHWRDAYTQRLAELVAEAEREALLSAVDEIERENRHFPISCDVFRNAIRARGEK